MVFVMNILRCNGLRNERNNWRVPVPVSSVMLQASVRGGETVTRYAWRPRAAAFTPASFSQFLLCTVRLSLYTPSSQWVTTAHLLGTDTMETQDAHIHPGGHREEPIAVLWRRDRAVQATDSAAVDNSSNPLAAGAFGGAGAGAGAIKG